MPEPIHTARVVRFGVFEVDLNAGELRKDGAKIKLQERPFEILTILLERPGEIITREEFRQRLWPADTFVDFDHSLNASINKLRQALDDPADTPRFVATAGRRGYRFVAPVRGTATATNLSLAPMQPAFPSDSRAAPANTTSAARPSRTKALKASVLVLGTVVLICFAAAMWFVRWRNSRSAEALTAKDSILLADFENSTGDPVFDGALKEALALQLEQSPFLNLVPNERVREILQYMDRPPDTRVTSELAFEMCEREGIKAMLSGSIASLGTHYVISLNAVNCRNGASLARQQVEAASKEEVLHVLGTAAPEMRRKLGETLATIEKFDAPIEEASTPSLEAMKAYTLAGDRRAVGQEPEAIPFYERAISLDPNFAMAYARLGGLYGNVNERVRGSDYLRKAYSLRARVSEAERLYITAQYFDLVLDDVPKTIETYDLWGQTYPQNWTPFNNLAVQCVLAGCYERAEQAARHALKLNPNHVFSYSTLCAALMGLGRFGEAKDICELGVAAHRENISIHQDLYDIGFVQADDMAMRREAEWSRGNTREGDMLYEEAMAAAATGKLGEARRLFAESIASARARGFAENAAGSAAMWALLEVEFGNIEQARREAKVALGLGDGQAERGVAALALALAGETASAQRIVTDLKKRFPQSTRVSGIRVPPVLAAIRMGARDPAQAVELLNSTKEYELGEEADLIPIYLRARCYLLEQSGDDAAREFQRILDHRGTDPVSPLLSLAHLGLARSYALSADTPRTRRSYDDFFALWKDGDADIPILVRARSEYAKLKAATKHP